MNGSTHFSRYRHPPISAVIVIRNLLQVGIAYTCGQICKLSQGFQVKPQIQHNGPGQLQHDRPLPPTPAPFPVSAPISILHPSSFSFALEFPQGYFQCASKNFNYFNLFSFKTAQVWKFHNFKMRKLGNVCTKGKGPLISNSIDLFEETWSMSSQITPLAIVGDLGCLSACCVHRAESNVTHPSLQLHVDL